MRPSFASQVVAALLAPVLLFAGGAQGLLSRCGASVGRHSCCCKKPGADAAVAQATVAAAQVPCCDSAVTPSRPEQQRPPQAVSALTGPAPVAPLYAEPALAALARAVPQRPPERDRGRPSPSLPIQLCSLLI